MDKDLSKEVHVVLESLLEEIENALNNLNNEGAKALQQGNYEKAREAIDMAKRLSRFREKVRELQKEWKQIFSPVFPPASQRWQRQRQSPSPRGAMTPLSAFRRPILEALVELGGQASPRKVLDLVERKMERTLNEHDYALRHDGRPRWENRAHWCRYQMVREGLLKADSPYGIWEISEKGRQALEQGQV